MTLTLLVDLDDTLLENSMATFLPAYFSALGSYLADMVEPQKLLEQLIASTQLMQANEDPQSTLQEVFENDFYPALDIEKGDVKELTDSFYRDIFPQLERVTGKVDGAVSFIEQALKKRYKVVIATNPLFLRAAVIERLRWVGLGSHIDDLELITTYEDFHFAKPNPAYYAEILATMGWPDDKVLMVGNDPQTDIGGAKALGLPTFWISEITDLDEGGRHSSGSLNEVHDWIDENMENLTLEISSPAAVKAILQATPAGFRTIRDHFSREEWHQQPASEEWSAAMVACHLRDVDLEINIPRLKLVMEEENAFIQGVDADHWAAERDYASQDGDEAMDAFITARVELLKTLRSLDEGLLDRPARHSMIGPTTLFELMRIAGRHDRLHVQQVYAQIPALQTG